MNSQNVKLKQTDCQTSKKKAFNKKKWREQKYSAKAKVSKWENIKRRQTLREYNKELKKSGITHRDSENKNREKQSKLKDSLKKAQMQYEKIQEEKQLKRKEKEMERQRREEALKAYKVKKAMRHKKLFHKNRPGRVSMKGRLELLLEEILKKHGKSDNELE